MTPHPTADDFRTALRKLLEAPSPDVEYVDISAGQLHRIVSGYPGRNHRMPECCRVMREMMQDGDEILSSPPKGNGASLTIRYYLASHRRKRSLRNLLFKRHRS